MKSIISTTLLCLYFFPFFTMGAEFTGLDNPIDSKSFDEVIAGVVGFLVPFGAAVLVIFILYGGFQMMTSGGDPKKHEAGRKTLLWAAIGFAILFLAGTTSTLLDALKEFFE